MGLCMVASKWCGGHALRSEPPQPLPRLLDQVERARLSIHTRDLTGASVLPRGYEILENRLQRRGPVEGGEPPRAHGLAFLAAEVKKYFVTSYE